MHGAHALHKINSGAGNSRWQVPHLSGQGTSGISHSHHTTQVVSGADTYQYLYNGLGDRLQSIFNGTATTYSLDLTSGLTQMLADGTNAYTYGFNRIAQVG